MDGLFIESYRQEPSIRRQPVGDRQTLVECQRTTVNVGEHWGMLMDVGEMLVDVSERRRTLVECRCDVTDTAESWCLAALVPQSFGALESWCSHRESSESRSYRGVKESFPAIAIQLILEERILRQ